MKIYWRVRTWSFSASGVLLNANDEEVPFSTSIGNIQSASEGDEGPIANTAEDQLVCGSGFFLNEDVEGNTWVRMGITNPVKRSVIYTAKLVGELMILMRVFSMSLGLYLLPHKHHPLFLFLEVHFLLELLT